MNALPLNDSTRPLCVDLDGTLIASDSLHEGIASLIKNHPGQAVALPLWVLGGKAQFKSRVAAHTTLDAALLPYHQDFLAWLREEHARGRRLVLATAADRQVARAVADHLGLFEEVISSGDGLSGSGTGKRDALVARYGEKGYDYAGNDRVDAVVWQSAHQAVVVGTPRIVAMADNVTTVERVFPVSPGGIGAWLQALRLHQWVKNALIFLPALLAHRIQQPEVLLKSALAFFAFGLCASSVYVFNDLFDLALAREILAIS